MGTSGLNAALQNSLLQLEKEGRLKGNERVTLKVVQPQADNGYRFKLEGFRGREFIKMDSNSYLGLHLNRLVLKAEHTASKRYGVGPGAVRFIDGTSKVHRQLEMALADFHGKEDSILFSSAYGAVCGALMPLVNEQTAVVSDELNHNCIINALRLARVQPEMKLIFKHIDYKLMREKIEDAANAGAERVLVITDGVFSMRGDHADLRAIQKIADEMSSRFKEGIITIVDDSHGVAAYGQTGRGTPEITGSSPDILVSTLGKGLGVDGGYVAADSIIVNFLRETSPFYIYSNPITPGSAGAALMSLQIINSNEGAELLARLRTNVQQFSVGVKQIGFETIEGGHPIVPVIVRDTARVKEMAKALFDNNVLVVGLGYPIVPKGEETLRFQVSAVHTKADIEYVLSALSRLK